MFFFFLVFFSCSTHNFSSFVSVRNGQERLLGRICQFPEFMFHPRLRLFREWYPQESVLGPLTSIPGGCDDPVAQFGLMWGSRNLSSSSKWALILQCKWLDHWRRAFNKKIQCCQLPKLGPLTVHEMRNIWMKYLPTFPIQVRLILPILLKGRICKIAYLLRNQNSSFWPIIFASFLLRNFLIWSKNEPKIGNHWYNSKSSKKNPKYVSLFQSHNFGTQSQDFGTQFKSAALDIDY